MGKRTTKVAYKAYIFLRAWRESRGLTVTELATRVNKAVSTVSGWERGKRQVDLADLTKLAGVYGVHPSALLLHPQEANPALEAMREASDIARSMDPDAAAAWLELGRKLPKTSNGR
jgi:transcriptional regulator with XRE-family HTH domain